MNIPQLGIQPFQRMRRLAIAGVGLVTALAAAVALPAATTVPATASEYLLGNGSVSLNVLEPTPGQVITGPTLPLQVQSVGYRLDARYAGTPDLTYVGHYHEILDGNLVDMTPARDPNNDTISMVGVTPGPHMLTIVPAANDHSMVWSAAVNISFIYAGPYLAPPAPAYFPNPPAISILSPVNGATVQGSFDITANVSNFVLCGECFGKANIDGVGHWHIFVDQPMMANMKTMAGGTTQAVALQGITPGWHTFYAVLVNNHHMPFMDMATGGLVPSTIASVTLFVQSAN